MHNTASIVLRIGFGLSVIAAPYLTAKVVHSQPSDTPLPAPRNLISPPIPYEDGVANIRAQDAARPKAASPKVRDDRSRLPDSELPSGKTSASPR
jgi:hypothetical protein